MVTDSEEDKDDDEYEAAFDRNFDVDIFSGDDLNFILFMKIFIQDKNHIRIRVFHVDPVRDIQNSLTYNNTIH